MQIMEDYKLKATNLRQYDSEELDWRIAGDTNHSSRLWFQKYFKENIENLKNKSVLDIGSGVGQLFPILQDLGASSIQGVEPSKRNSEHSRELYPHIVIHNCGLNEFKSVDVFDVAVCIAAFEHIFDIKEAFRSVAKALKNGGSFYLIIGDKGFNTKSHANFKGFVVNVDVQELGDGIVATKTSYEEGIIYDIFRPQQAILDAATQSDFILQKSVDMVSTKGGTPFRLLIFKRT
jgi:SAM-dependent methyltransferase